MNIDFHTHVKLAKKVPFSSEYTTSLFREAKKSGLDGLCLTEHYNTLGFKQVYNYILQQYPRSGDSFLVEGMRVFPGMEVDIREGGHILIIGTMENIMKLNDELEPYKEVENFLTFKELLLITEKYDFIIGCAHPFRGDGNIPYLSKELLKKLDFVDMNGKDYAMKGTKSREDVITFADSLGIPPLAGSDTHQFVQYGCIWNKFEKECKTISELRESIQKRAYEIEVLDYIDYKVNTAIILKKALKEIHACGGDYVSVLV